MNRQHVIWFALAISVLVAGCGIQSPLQVDTTSIPAATARHPYLVGLAAQGGNLPFKWSLAAGQLPPGVILSSQTGQISGTPLAEGEFHFQVMVTDSAVPSASAVSPKLRLKVKGQSSGSPLAITTTSLPNGTVQAAYNTALGASGGTTPYKWSVSAGSLPPGIALSGAGALSGTPSSSGQFSFTVQVQDSTSPPQRATQALSVTIASATSPLQISTSSLPAGAVQVAYSAALSASGGTSPYAWSAIGGTVPPGLALGISGSINGTPTQAGTFLFSAQVKDSTGQTASSSFTVNVAPAASPVISSLSPSSGPTSGGTSVTISGSNFVSGATVSFGSVSASATLVSASQIKATSPAHIAGTVQVIVQQNGQSSGGANFTYNTLAPTVTSISPNSGTTAGGTQVTITGTNFLAGALVLFGTASSPSVTVVSATQIQAVTPANPAGPVSVTVQDPGSVTGSISSGYTYVSPSTGPPTISSFSPTTGAAGTQVTITGTNFTSADTVTFGSNPASSTFVSATQITAQVPNVAAGTYSITVNDPAPATAAAPSSFTITATQAQSLLAGCSVDASNNPTCSLPSGWAKVAAQGFESGSLAGSQTMATQEYCSSTGAGIVTAGGAAPCGGTAPLAHSGTKMYGGMQSSDGDVIAVSEHGPGTYNDLYISFWDYEDSNALVPEEFFIAMVTNCDQGSCGSMWQQSGWDWEAGPGYVNQSLPSQNMSQINDTTNSGGNPAHYYTGNLSINAGSWRQYEIWFHPNTVTGGTPNNDGFMYLYVNGVLSKSKTGTALDKIFGNGGTSPTMGGGNSGAKIEIGGVITAFCDTAETIRATPFSKCSAPAGGGVGAPAPYHRYIDDIIILKK